MADTATRRAPTGIDRYFHSLPEHLRRLGRPLEVRKIGLREYLRALSPPQSWFGLGPLLTLTGILGRTVRVNLPNTDLLHLSTPLPVRWDGPLVVTIHDCATLLPQTRALSPLHARLAFRKTVGRLGRSNCWFIAVSDCTKRDFEMLFPSLAGRISRVYHGIDPTFRPRDRHAIEQARDRYNLPKSYFMLLGAMGKRKNLDRLLTAYREATARDSSIPNLVAAGRTEWGGQEFRAAVDSLGLTSRISFLGFVPQNHLSAVLSGATALLYPSIYEGFGWPPLEAMACGVPVLVSNQAALMETTGGHAVVVDPLNVRDISAGLLRLAQDEGLRSELRCVGLDWVKQFTWDSTARQTLDLFQMLSSDSQASRRDS